MKRVIRWSIPMVLFVVGTGRSSVAQRVAYDEHHAARDESVGSVFAKPVTLDLDDASVEYAIRAVAKRAQVRISYDADALDRITTPVTLRASALPLGVVLERILRGTGLCAQAVSDDAVTLKTVSRVASVIHGSITGKVIDAKTRQGVRWAAVSLSGTQKTATTRDDGTFRLVDVAAGTYTIHVRLLGYLKAAKKVTVVDGQTTTLDVVLEPSVNALDQVVVTGTVAAVAQREVPNAMTVITAKDIEQRGITRIDQLFRGDVPGLFVMNRGSNNALDQVTMYSRGATQLPISNGSLATSPIKTYVDGIELANSAYLSQIDPRSIERIEIVTGPQASAIYGSNAINGVMQIFTKRGTRGMRPQLRATLQSGLVQNNMRPSLTPQHDYSASVNGTEGHWSYNAGGSWVYVGPWAPSKQTATVSGFGGARFTIGPAAADVSLRLAQTRNRSRGDASQIYTNFRESGFYAPTPSSGRAGQTLTTLDGQTLGLTVTYAPFTWWSHELVLGSDVANVESHREMPGFLQPSDTALLFTQSPTTRSSVRYAMTTHIPITPLARLVLTAGADYWHSLNTTLTATPVSLTGTLTGVGTGATAPTRQPGHNTGTFVQGQLGVWDALFLTYGLRAEWNPDYGSDVGASVAPRYGLAYTRDLVTPLGPITTKLRASYGRATRPPAPSQKRATIATDDFLVAVFGPYVQVRANPDLGPEFQQGGEAGLELYFGNHGSLVVTRYNQTVDALIAGAQIDSVTPLNPDDAILYGYGPVAQNLNIGSIRNQGWEVHATVNAGPLTASGTYSWTKSRVIGITPKFRAQFSNAATYPQYQPGATFGNLPEHTWASTVTYERSATMVSLTLNGAGFLTRIDDEFGQTVSPLVRLSTMKPRFGIPLGYQRIGPAYQTTDVNVTHRFSSAIEGIASVENVTDVYRNDYAANFATMGRHTKAGLRIRM